MPDDNLTRAEVTERLCALLARVNEHLGWTHACDCICGKSGFPDVKWWTDEQYRNDGTALAWLEALVAANLPKETPDAR
jgi:hypothetical protein